MYSEAITVHLADARVVSVPLAWSWRLSDATPEQRSNFEITGNGHGVRWPDIDEDLSAAGALAGVPAHRPKVHAYSVVALESTRVNRKVTGPGCRLHKQSRSLLCDRRSKGRDN